VVTTFSGAGFADGTTLYSVAPPPDIFFYDVGRAVTTSNNSIALLFVDHRPSGISFRATTLTGSQLWRSDLGIPNAELLAWTPDNQGGLVASLFAGGVTTYVGIDGSGNQRWHFQIQSPGVVLYQPAIAPDGTLYIVDPNGALVALNGATGIPKFSVPLPGNIFVAGQPEILANGNVCSAVIEDPFAGASFDDVPNQPVSLELVCTTPSGASSVSALSRKVSTRNDTFHFSFGHTISDEDGNPVSSWGVTESLQVGGPIFTKSVSGSGGQTTLPGCIPGANVDTSPMALGDTGAVYVTCHTSSSSTAFPTLVYSVNPGSSVNWSWQVPIHHRLELMGTTFGGGAIVNDITLGPNDLGVSAENIVDLDVAGNAVSEAWSTSANSNLAYLGVGLFVDTGDQSAASPAHIIMASTSDANSAWQAPAANTARQHRGQSAEFIRDQACSGFDETINPRMLMVPASGSNTLKAKLHGNIRQDVQFVSDNASVTVSPLNPTADTTLLTVTASAALNPAQTNPVTIKAVSIAEPTYSYGSFTAVVKPWLNGNLTMYKVTESVRNLTPSTVPTASSMQGYLQNTTWGRQANVFFTVDASNPISLSVHYDLLPVPDGNGVLDDFQGANFGSIETAAIAQAFLGLDPHSGDNIGHTVVSYVSKFGPRGGVPCPPGKICALDGETLNGTHVSFVQGLQEVGSNSRENVTAHEIGHGMGPHDIDIPGFPKSENKSLMWIGPGDGDPPNPCEIRDREWRAVNPTPGDN